MRSGKSLRAMLFRRSSTGLSLLSLANTERGENLTEKIVGGKLAGDLGERQLCLAKIFCQQFTRKALIECAPATLEMSPGFSQCFEVSTSCNEFTRFFALVAHGGLEVRDQGLYPLPCFRRQPDHFVSELIIFGTFSVFFVYFIAN